MNKVPKNRLSHSRMAEKPDNTARGIHIARGEAGKGQERVTDTPPAEQISSESGQTNGQQPSHLRGGGSRDIYAQADCDCHRLHKRSETNGGHRLDA